MDLLVCPYCRNQVDTKHVGDEIIDYCRTCNRLIMDPSIISHSDYEKEIMGG